MMIRPGKRANGGFTASNTLLVAMVLSIALHLVLYPVYRLAKGFHWAGYEKVVAFFTPKPSQYTPALLKWLTPKPKPLPQKQILQPTREIQVTIESQPPTVFLAVDPLQATVEEPKNPKYYSDKNSLAANREIKRESDDPNLDGKQKLIPFTMDVPRQNLQPAPVQNPTPRPPDKQASEEKNEDAKATDLPEKQPKEVAEERPKPKGGETIGDLALAKPSDRKLPSDGLANTDQGKGNEFKDKQTADQPAKPSRPRTLIEARSRMQDNTIAGQKMKQEGGVKHQLEFSALDAKATPFGAYDNAIVAAIQQRWYDLLDRSRFSGDRRGRVVLEFRLHSNGRISNMIVAENTVGDFLGSLCQSAVMDPAPYAKWPVEMQRLFSGDFREVRFTFHYN